jgi:hypothetical protein
VPQRATATAVGSSTEASVLVRERRTARSPPGAIARRPIEEVAAVLPRAAGGFGMEAFRASGCIAYVGLIATGGTAVEVVCHVLHGCRTLQRWRGHVW